MCDLNAKLLASEYIKEQNAVEQNNAKVKTTCSCYMKNYMELST